MDDIYRRKWKIKPKFEREREKNTLMKDGDKLRIER